MLKRILRSRRGEGYIDVCVLVLCAMLVIALAVQVLPAFIAKQQLDTFATELVREAEIAGRIGPETDRREQALREQTGLDPEIEWSDTGRIQLNEEVTVTLTHEIDLGLFAGFGSFPITLRADATGKSEVVFDDENEKDALCGRNGNDAGHHVYGTRICGRNRGCGWCH